MARVWMGPKRRWLVGALVMGLWGASIGVRASLDRPADRPRPSMVAFVQESPQEGAEALAGQAYAILKEHCIVCHGADGVSAPAT
jgi:cytochrome c5